MQKITFSIVFPELPTAHVWEKRRSFSSSRNTLILCLRSMEKYYEGGGRRRFKQQLVKVVYLSCAGI